MRKNRREIQRIGLDSTTGTSSDVAMIEEENCGRLLFAHTDGRVLAEFINKGKDGKSYRMGWSRYLTEAAGDAALSGLGGTCNGG